MEEVTIAEQELKPGGNDAGEEDTYTYLIAMVMVYLSCIAATVVMVIRPPDKLPRASPCC